VKRQMRYFREKMEAANLMDRALRTFVGASTEKSVNADSEAFRDSRLDAVIGQQYSLITTEMGSFETKVMGANPNLAAVAVDLLTKAGVERGEFVACGFTGSDPGVNTAVLCACQALGATPVTITSVGSSWWGANDPDFTWLDMEALLNKHGVIHSIPVAASMGGINDAAVGLSQVGQDLIKEAVQRNGLTLVHEGDLAASVTKRYEQYQTAASGHKYAAYVNVGQGITSLGDIENASLVKNGLNRRLPLQNYPARGVIHRFNAGGVPVIHLFDIPAISRDYGLGGAHVPLPAVGDGDVYVEDRYDLRVAAISAALAILLIIILVRFDARLFKLSDAGVDPDTLM
jgi:poly-gamma-glutamate system protein